MVSKHTTAQAQKLVYVVLVHYGRSTTVVGGMFSRFSLGGKDKKEEKESPSKGRASMQSVSSDTVDFNAMLDNSFLASTL